MPRPAPPPTVSDPDNEVIRERQIPVGKDPPGEGINSGHLFPLICLKLARSKVFPPAESGNAKPGSGVCVEVVPPAGFTATNRAGNKMWLHSVSSHSTSPMHVKS